MTLISFVIPVYNTGEYLQQCIDSIISQTWKNIEIIAVDDGSTDNSLSILEKYAQSHPNIYVFHKENGGVSSARNLGLDHIHGEYVFFVDSDDWVEPCFAEQYMQCGNAPYVAGGYTEWPNVNYKMCNERYSVNMDEYIGDLANNFPKIPSVHVIHNRYSSSVIKENNLRFDEGSRCGEDIRFNVNYFRCIDRLEVIDRCDYFYRMRSDSAIHSFWENRLEEEREECQLRETILGTSSDFHMVKYIHWHTALEHYFEYSDKSFEKSKEASKQLKATVKDSYFRTCLHWMLVNGSKDMIVESICLRLGSYSLYKAIWKAFTKLYNFKK